MKKLIAISIVALMVLCVGVVSYADEKSTEKTVALHMGVNDSFGFEVWDDDLDQIIDTIDPGQTGFADLHIYASSNHGNPWSINAASDGLIGTYHGGVLDIKVSTFDGASVGLTGTMVDNLVLTGTAQPIYSSGSGESYANGLQVSGLFIIPTEVSTGQDYYEGTVALTMTE